MPRDCRSKITCSRAFVSCALAAALLATASAWAEPVADSRVLTVRFRVEPRAGAARDACAHLEPSDLSIRLRGRTIDAADIVSLARDARPMLHALVIDRSGSMENKLDAARRAAQGYVARLRPGLDRGLVVAFDEDIVLGTAATADPASLARAIDGVAPGGMTALKDALIAVIHEVSLQPERPVILLLSDGMDTASLADESDVLALAAERPDLTVFPIGLALPSLDVANPKTFLEALARRTDGEFLDIPTPSRLARAYDHVRDLLDAEWELVFADPEPALDAARPKIRVTGRPCSLRLLGKHADDERAARANAALPVARPAVGEAGDTACAPVSRAANRFAEGSDPTPDRNGTASRPPTAFAAVSST